MKKHYGLISMICGILSILIPFIFFAPALAVLFAVLYKKSGDESNEKQHSFARFGGVVGAFMAGLWNLILIYALLVTADVPDTVGLVLGFVAAVGTIVLCAWLYWRKWNKETEPVKVPPVVADPNRITLLKEDPTRGDLHLYLLELVCVDSPLFRDSLFQRGILAA